MGRLIVLRNVDSIGRGKVGASFENMRINREVRGLFEKLREIAPSLTGQESGPWMRRFFVNMYFDREFHSRLFVTRQWLSWMEGSKIMQFHFWPNIGRFCAHSEYDKIVYEFISRKLVYLSSPLTTAHFVTHRSYYTAGIVLRCAPRTANF